MSEEFGGALVSDIIAEQRRLPVGFLEQVIEYRAYASAHAANDINAPGWETSALRTMARQIELGIAQEEIDAHG